MKTLETRNRGIASHVLTATLAAATLTSAGCVKVTKDTEFSIKQTTTTIAYTKDGDPVDPLELVAIDRAGDAEENTESETKDTVATPEATASASADSDSKEETSEDSEKESSKEKETSTDSDEENTDETVDLADEAYIADGLEVEKVYPEVIDTSVVGDVEVLFTVKDTENNDSTAELSVTFTVVDETAPAFKLTKTEDTVTVNSEFDAKSYIKDDAGCEYVEEEPEDSSEYENGWYTITSNVSTKKAGSYKVKYHAENTSGTATDVTLKITVSETATSSSEDSSSNSKNNDSSSKKTTTSSSSKTTSNSSNSTNNSSSSSTSYSEGTDMYNGVIQTDGCSKKLVHHDAVTKTYVSGQNYVKDADAVTEEWWRCTSCNAEFSSEAEAKAHCDEQKHFSYANFLKTISAEQGHYEDNVVTETIVPAYDEYVCE
jgi:hypothetical protein